MPVMRCARGCYKWGLSGKCYPTRAEDEKQGRASMAMKKGKKKKGSRGGRRG